MSMRLLFRYAGGLACLVTALTLVACGGGPGAQPGTEGDREHSVSAGREGPHDSSFR